MVCFNELTSVQVSVCLVQLPTACFSTNCFIRACLAVLEVYQFAHDAAVAECWLISQEPYLANQDLGVRASTPNSLLFKAHITVLSNLSYSILFNFSSLKSLALVCNKICKHIWKDNLMSPLSLSRRRWNKRKLSSRDTRLSRKPPPLRRNASTVCSNLQR